MKFRPALRLWPVGLFLAATVAVNAAFSTGGVAYTKRYKTILLAEPSPQAKSTGELAFARKVKIEQAQGNWLRVNDGSIAGWIFLGSLSEIKPDESKGLDGAPLLASSTRKRSSALWSGRWCSVATTAIKSKLSSAN